MKEKEIKDASVVSLIIGIILLAFSISILILKPDAEGLYKIGHVLIGILGLMALLTAYSNNIKSSIINELKKELRKNFNKPN